MKATIAIVVSICSTANGFPASYVSDLSTNKVAKVTKHLEYNDFNGSLNTDKNAKSDSVATFFNDLNESPSPKEELAAQAALYTGRSLGLGDTYKKIFKKEQASKSPYKPQRTLGYLDSFAERIPDASNPLKTTQLPTRIEPVDTSITPLATSTSSASYMDTLSGITKAPRPLPKFSFFRPSKVKKADVPSVSFSYLDSLPGKTMDLSNSYKVTAHTQEDLLTDETTNEVNEVPQMASHSTSYLSTISLTSLDKKPRMKSSIHKVSQAKPLVSSFTDKTLELSEVIVPPQEGHTAETLTEVNEISQLVSHSTSYLSTISSTSLDTKPYVKPSTYKPSQKSSVSSFLDKTIHSSSQVLQPQEEPPTVEGLIGGSESFQLVSHSTSYLSTISSTSLDTKPYVKPSIHKVSKAKILVSSLRDKPLDSASYEVVVTPQEELPTADILTEANEVSQFVSHPTYLSTTSSNPLHKKPYVKPSIYKPSQAKPLVSSNQYLSSIQGNTLESLLKSKKMPEPPTVPKMTSPKEKQNQSSYLDTISGVSSTSKPFVKRSIFAPSKTKKQTSSVGYLDFLPGTAFEDSVTKAPVNIEPNDNLVTPSDTVTVTASYMDSLSGAIKETNPVMKFRSFSHFKKTWR